MKKFTTKKSLGQNFLVNKGILDKIIRAAELDKNDTILEIGPGTGVLTKKLARNAGRVIAVEKDCRLVEMLKTEILTKSVDGNVEIVEEDVLKFNPTTYNLKPKAYKVIGNIPYYITSYLLKTVFEKWPVPIFIVLMVQKEVAQRIVAKPPEMSLLALSVQFYAEPKIVSYVSRGSFRPMPKVDSAIIRLIPNSEQRTANSEQFFKLIKTAFAGKRKQLKNTLGIEILKNTGIKPESRPEELSLDDWLKLASEV